MNFLKKILLAFFLIAGSFYTLSAQHNSELGVRVKESLAHTTVYEVKIKGMFSPIHATRIDDFFKTKTGVVAVSTNFETGISTVEAKPGYTTELLIEIVESAGFTVAKSFDE